MLFSLFLMGVGVFAVASAWYWPFAAALFPLAVRCPLVILAGIHLALDLRGPSEPAVGPTTDTPPPDEGWGGVARWRSGTLFAWIVAFVLLVALVGFPTAVPVFVASYLRLESAESWWRATALAVAAWAFFHGVFQWALRLPFEPGWAQTWLGW